MIRFGCPVCKTALECPDRKAGRKLPCPKCGQRLLVPSPTRNQTMLGEALPSKAPARREAPLSGQVPVGECPGCRSPVTVPAESVGRWVNCQHCGTGFAAFAEGPGPAPGPAFDSFSPEPPAYRQPALDPSGFAGPAADTELGWPDEPRPKHSGLGIASFLIALLVGGLDVILAVAITAGIARSSPRTSDELKANVVAGGVAMVCLNYMSLPLCLVGVGLGGVGLVVHRGQNHLFTWIGLCGNGVVIFVVVGLHLIGLMLRA
jgi:DNA-directed RNA polymerase subunit RPC12/RpoP